MYGYMQDTPDSPLTTIRTKLFIPSLHANSIVGILVSISQEVGGAKKEDDSPPSSRRSRPDIMIATRNTTGNSLLASCSLKTT